MEIVINHLFRTEPGKVAVAGIFMPDAQTHIRPCPPADISFNREMIKDRGGPFCLGAVINIAQTKWQPRRPHVEDHIVESEALSQSGRIDQEHFWKLLDENAQDSLSDIFGNELRATGFNFNLRVIDENQGLASLGLLRVKSNDAILTVEGGVKIWLNESGARACLRVNDVRLHYDDGKIRYDLAEAIADRLNDGERCILSVGLSRAWSPDGKNRYHLAQVNNIYFQADPLGDTWFSN
ncbi:MAG: hypothetical protein U0105_24145 [Candidatus Obscuribacterales bacterium]